MGIAANAAHPESIVGREAERLRVRAFVDGLPHGSRALLIRGEPGIGKTALLRHAARQASGLRTIEVEGVQAEMELAYAGIHLLCRSLWDGLETLPAPQQNALEVALGIAAGAAPDRFLVAVAVLNLLHANADERPLLCLIDDAHWLDAASRPNDDI